MDNQTKETQMKETIEAFGQRPKTTKMVAVETGIQRSNITRYVSKLEKHKKIVVIKREPCEITKHKAKYYSTDPHLVKSKEQAELFPEKRQGPNFE